jgi:hypothetical protein
MTNEIIELLPSADLKAKIKDMGIITTRLTGGCDCSCSMAISKLVFKF